MAILIALGGGSGSGKTSIARALVETIGKDASRFSFDNYYRDQSHLSVEERSKVNYDSPFTLDTTLFIEHLKRIKEDRVVEVPQYDFVTHTRLPSSIPYHPTKYVIIDGILTLYLDEAEDLFDYKIFVKADSDIRLARRIRRDTLERGRTADSVISQYLATVRPMHLKYVEPSRFVADFVFDNNKETGIDQETLDVVKAKILRLGKTNEN
mgnify:CR=1 FL=1